MKIKEASVCIVLLSYQEHTALADRAILLLVGSSCRFPSSGGARGSGHANNTAVNVLEAGITHVQKQHPETDALGQKLRNV